MSQLLSIMLGLDSFAPDWLVINKRAYVDGKAVKPIKRNVDKNKGCLRLSQQASKELRALVLRTLALGGRYSAFTLHQATGKSESALRKHLKNLANEGIAQSETITNPYSITWYWIE